MKIAGLIIIWVGVFFSIVGVVGILRFPDVYTRLHASGKVATLGVLSLLVGGALLMPSAAVKLIVLGLFMIITAPVASHAIGLAAYRQGVPMKDPVRDDLQNRGR